MPRPVVYYRATKKTIQTHPVLGYAYVFILQHHSLRSISCLAESTGGALGSVMHSPEPALGETCLGEHCWDLPAAAVPITLVLHHLCKQGKCGSLGSSSHFSLLMQTSARMCQQCAFRCGTHSLAGEQSRTSSQRCQLFSPAQLCQKVHPRGSVVLSSWSHPGRLGIHQLSYSRCFYAAVHQNADFWIKNWNCGRYGTVPYCFIEEVLSCKGIQLGKPLQKWWPSWTGARAEVERATLLLLRAECGFVTLSSLKCCMDHSSVASLSL